MQSSLGQLTRFFLRLGFTAFGGPAAHIAMMEEEVVRRRNWLSRETFLDLLGAVNLIPGPNSTEMAIFIGYRLAGWRGLLVAGSCFILPAAVIVGAIAHFYVKVGRLPEVQAILYGIKPVIMAIVLQALWSLGGTVFKGWKPALVAIAAAAASLAGANELAVLAGAGILALLMRPSSGRVLALAPMWLLAQAGGAVTAPAAALGSGFSLGKLFLFFLKVGSVLYGSGYVLLAFLRGDLVERWGWLTESQLLDAIAVGQFTPGPVFTTATFIGYLLAGTPGAVVSTLGIFLPSFVLVGLSGWVVPRIRKSPWAGAFLDGVNAASLALMGVVCLQLGGSALVDAVTVMLALASAVALFKFRVNSVWLILAGAAVGWLTAIVK